MTTITERVSAADDTAMVALPARAPAPTAPAARAEVGRRNELARMEWVERTLARIPAGWRLLDAGAGEQQFRRFCGHLRYVSQDFAEYDGKGDGAALHPGKWETSGLDIISDIAAIPESDGSFDAVLCTEVFEHLPDPLAALNEFSRLLRPGGRLILTAPFCSLTHLAPYHFATGFSRYWYRTHLPVLGFEVQELKENGNFFEYLAQEVRRSRGVARRYANDNLSDDEWAAAQTLLGAMERLSAKDRGSSELLHFGCHVLAMRT